MLKRLASVSVLALTACATTTSTTTGTSSAVASLAPAAEVTSETLLALNAMCGADASAGKTYTRSLSLAPGMGTGGFKVDSANRQAQDWFNYGLALSHAFYHEDAKAAMKLAVEADPQCSLCAWGEAWSLGPTLNFRINEKEREAALAAANRALSLAKPGDEKARRLAEIIVARYQKSETSTEPAFGVEMAKVAAAYTGEADLAVLASHALLIPVRAKDESGLKPALAILERVLKEHPDDTGAIHYYIHATEFDDRAEDALAYAYRLGDLAPAASHLVHMPAHTFFRAGRYQDAAVVNAQAIGADASWLRAGGDPSATAPMYYAHNVSFGLAGSLMSGDAALALKYAEHAVTVWPDASAGRPRNSVLPRTWVALARHAPDRALAIPELTGDPRFVIYRAYARGEAFLQKGNVEGARAEAKALVAVAGDTELPEQAIARGVLEGRIAMVEGDMAKAAMRFAEAAAVQEAKLSDSWDPPAWWYPVRRSLAAAYLKAGDFVEAEAEATKSLKSWKHDPMALWVLARAEAGLGRAADAAVHLQEARKGWRGDFGSITVDAI